MYYITGVLNRTHDACATFRCDYGIRGIDSDSSASEMVSTLDRTSCVISTSANCRPRYVGASGTSVILKSGRVVTVADPVSRNRESRCFGLVGGTKADKMFFDDLCPASSGAPKLLVQSGLSVHSRLPAIETASDLLRMCRMLSCDSQYRCSAHVGDQQTHKRQQNTDVRDKTAGAFIIASW